VSTHYQTLGVDGRASYGEVKKAWKQAARQTHPDLNEKDPQAAQKFNAVMVAWDVLKDQAARARYDRDLLNPNARPVVPRPTQSRPTHAKQRTREAPSKDPDQCLDCEEVRLPHLLRCPHCENVWKRRKRAAPRGSMGLAVGYYTEQMNLEDCFVGVGIGRDGAGAGRWIKPGARRSKRRPR
jgi:curved DNA-binding protein CbpA